MAKQGYGLDKLIIIGSKDCDILEPIIDHNYKLDALLETHYVDRQLAEHGYFLDVLINHRNTWVRKAVAEQGYGLDRLINDKSEYVREAVIKKAKELGYDIDIQEENNTEVTTTDSPTIKSKLSKESLEFLVEFFTVLSSKNLKTDEQLLDILDKYTDWDSHSGSLKLINVPDELNDRFENFLKHINVLVTEGTYETGYANMSTANTLIYNTNEYLYSEYSEDDLENFDIQSEVDDDLTLYWIETGIMPEYGGIGVKSTKFKDPIVFAEIIKIFELADEDIKYIQKELNDASIQ